MNIGTIHHDRFRRFRIRHCSAVAAFVLSVVSFNTLSTNIRRPMTFTIFSNLETSDSSSREAQAAQFGRNRFQKVQRSVRHIIVCHSHTQFEADYLFSSLRFSLDRAVALVP